MTEEKERFTACQTCGFPKEVKRNPVFVKNSPESYVAYEENKCFECGSQKDGSTIPVVADLMRSIVDRKNKEKQELLLSLREELKAKRLRSPSSEALYLNGYRMLVLKESDFDNVFEKRLDEVKE